MTRLRAPSSAVAATLLLAAIALLGWLNWRLLQTEIDTQPLKRTVSETEPFQDAPQAFGDFKLPPIKEFSEITARPIFNPSRRQANAVQRVARRTHRKPKPPRPARTSLAQMRLLGILINGGERQAFVTTPRIGKGAWLAENASFEGWKILRIEDNRIVLKSGTDRRELSLYKEGPSSAAGQITGSIHR